jgi:uncharacterized protein
MAQAIKWTVTSLMGFMLLAIVLALGAVGPGNIGRMALGVGISYDKSAPNLPVLTNPAILIFSRTNCFRDDAQIKAANAALEKLPRAKADPATPPKMPLFSTPNSLVSSTPLHVTASAVMC